MGEETNYLETCQYAKEEKIPGRIPFEGPTRFVCDNPLSASYLKTCVLNWDHNDFRQVGDQKKLVQLVELADWKASDCKDRRPREVLVEVQK
ncbi:hypothetical protein KA107_03320 [Candidatus Pacearchaeota archaeon]|nr:hypothetical protein [Candidatus Pacearchaeota archaeon]